MVGARRAVAWAVLLAGMAGAPVAGRAQTVTAVPRLDIEKFTAPWYEMARLPDRREKQCVGDNLVLFGLRDKKNTFAVVISCLIKNNNWNYWNLPGKLSKDGSGRLELSRLFFFRTKYWVIAADPAMNWMLVGTPNHKTLEVLSRTPEMPPAVLDQLKARASAQGFNTAKLVPVTHHGTDMNPEATEKAPATPIPRPAVQPGTEHTPQPGAGSTPK